MQNKQIFYFLILSSNLIIPLNGMVKSSNNSEALPMSTEELEKKLCILHERDSTLYNNEISESIHLLFAENARTKVTHFCPASEEECNTLIEKVCSKGQKIWWFVTPNTKKFNLEKKLQKKGLAPYPLPAMIYTLTEKKLEQEASSDDAISIKAEASSPNMTNYKLLYNTAQVSQGSLFFHENWAGIHSIETKPEQRKKGFATLLMKYLLDTAQNHGATHAILESSPEAYKLYEKLGFKEIFQTIIYYRE